MLKALIRVVALGVFLWSGVPYAYSQRTTEIYIPIGRSPGLSGKATLIGKVEGIDPRDRLITIAGPSRTVTVKITDRTKIWLDRSQLRLTNVEGSFADLREGRLVEVKYAGEEPEEKGPVQWIKVQISQQKGEQGGSRQ